MGCVYLDEKAWVTCAILRFVKESSEGMVGGLRTTTHTTTQTYKSIWQKQRQ